jgi:transcription antitermination factor NusG
MGGGKPILPLIAPESRPRENAETGVFGGSLRSIFSLEQHMGCDFAGGQWFALQTRPGHEQAAANVLRYKGYDEFVPLRRSIRSCRAARPRPLFPGYVFCRARAGVIGPVVTTLGVIRILGIGGQPATIPESEINAIRQILDAGLSAIPHAYIETGQRIRIISGPLTGARGILLAQGANSRFVVSLTLLRRSVVVSVDADWVTIDDSQSALHAGARN